MLNCHWRELSQVLFLSRQTRGVVRDKSVFIATKDAFCRYKNMLDATKFYAYVILREIFVATKMLSRQTHVCCDKHNFVAANIVLSRQRFSHDKHTLVETNTYLSRQNTSFVATNGTCLSRQNVCRDKKDTCLSRQK